jgi:RNA polymerase primary sigma factor
MTACARPRRRRARVAADVPDGDGASLDSYLREVGRYPLLSASEEHAIGLAARAGDAAAVTALVTRNLRFVVSVAKAYQHRGLPLIDLIGEGNVGLFAAARHFDPARGVRFVSYAVWWIRQAIRSALIRQRHIVRLPADRVAELARINRAADALRQELAREPTFREIAATSAAPVELVRSARAYGARDVSLDTPMDSEGELTLLDRFELEREWDPDHEATAAVLGDRVDEALRLLPSREAEILRLHFGLDGERAHTLEAIGEQLGVTRERVRQLRNRALRRMRDGEAASALGDFSCAHRGRESP